MSKSTEEAEKKVFLPPEKIETFYANKNFDTPSGNRPTAGARTERELPRGSASIQYYGLSTPNGNKTGILLEELGVDYDAHQIHIGKGDQFSSGFVDLCPNSKIPAAIDYDGPEGETVKLWESASIMLYFAEKYKKFIPAHPAKKAEMINWLFWQIGSQGPNTGNFGHFMVHAPEEEVEARTYGVTRYGMEVQRCCSVLNTHLKDRQFMMGDEYTIADMAIFPWVRAVRVYYKAPNGVDGKMILSVEENYPVLCAWADRIAERPAVQRGLQVCLWDNSRGTKPWLHPDNEEKK